MTSKNNPLLYDGTLKTFVNEIDNISASEKKEIIESIPYLGLEKRKELFEKLTRIYILNLREKEELKRVEDFWKKE